MKYVLYCLEHLRDGHNEWARVFDSLDDVNNFFSLIGNENLTFRLFEIGSEIPLEKYTKPQPPLELTKIRVKP